MDNSQTQFGFETISASEKKERVQSIFTEVSSVYDHMNDLMSLGLHHHWKRQAVLALQVESSHTVLDLACGSGDLSALLAPKLSDGSLYCVDPNPAMLSRSESRLSYPNLHFHLSEAETLDLDVTFDRAILSFGLRNFVDPALGLHRIHQHLKPGGKLVILEFNPPDATPFTNAYPWYLNQVLPTLGDWVAQDAKSYQYLADSIQTQPLPQDRIAQLKSQGYDIITYSPILFGIVGLFEAYRCT